MSTLTLRAPVKVNLVLRILAREVSGYHQLETLYQALDWGDRVSLEFIEGAAIEIDLHPTGDVTPSALGDPAENLAVRAARAYLERAGLSGSVVIGLEKLVPPGRGLGGGSSDAGAVLRGLDRLTDGAVGRDELVALAGRLGADVPFFLSASPLAWGWGRGDRIVPLEPLESLPALVAMPAEPMSTPEAYRLLAETSRHYPGARAFDLGPAPDWSLIAEQAVNDFEPVLAERLPESARCLSRLREAGAEMALLAGSGSAVFGLFSNDARLAEATSALAETGSKTAVVRTRTLEDWPLPEEGAG